jgi:hypothetical protein
VSEFEKYRYCDFCGASFDPQGTTRRCCDEECRQRMLPARRNSPAAKFGCLKRTLEEDRIRESDDRLIWNFEFYEALIAGNQCDVCDGPLGGGHSIDRRDNSKGHLSTNIAYILCQECNRLRSSLYIPDEFALFRPVLITIREQRDAQKSKRR